MSGGLAGEIRQFIVKELQQKAREKRVEFSKNEDMNIIESGLVDSLGFLELMAPIEKRFHITIDFSELDPAEFTSLNKLSYQCAKLVKQKKPGGSFRDPD